MKRVFLSFAAALIAGTMMAQMPNVPAVPETDKPMQPIATMYNGYMMSMSNEVSLWKGGNAYVPKYYIVRDETNYYLGIEERQHEAFSVVNVNTDPNLYLTTDKGEQITLKCYESRPIIYCFTISGGGSTNQEGYFTEAPIFNYFSTHVLYCIDNIDEFLGRTYTKISCLSGQVEHEYAAKDVASFNKEFSIDKATVDRNYTKFRQKIDKLSPEERKRTLEYYIDNDTWKYQHR